MSEVFNHKIFNGEVFRKYVESLPNPRKTELLKSRAIRPRPDLAGSLSDQVAGNYITTPMTGLISGGKPQNYDGNTDLESESTYTFAHSRVVVGRAKSWKEADFTYEVTGGKDFMEVIAQQIAEYWDEIDQDTIVSILNGIFKMTDAEGKKFVSAHTFDITSRTNSEGTTGHMDATSLNTAMQRACGDNKGKFSLAIMHSYVATNLENLKLLAYLKYTDKDGVTRDLAIGTLNGRVVLVDDSMPVSEIVTQNEVKGTHTITVGTKGVEGDTVTINGVVYTIAKETSFENKTIAVGSSASTQASALKSVLAEQFEGVFDVSVSAAVVTLTQITGGTGAAPVVAAFGTLAVSIASPTAGKAQEVQSTYTTYVLGDGAIEYTDCGAKVPYEMDRDPAKNGGEDLLYSRQRKCWAPYGISFTKKKMRSLSPTDAELASGINWELVNSIEEEDGSKKYIAHKAIPIARILSLG